jgi:hypothetical protein
LPRKKEMMEGRNEGRKRRKEVKEGDKGSEGRK